MSVSVDSDAAVDATIMSIAQAMGVPTDRIAPVVDQYGCEYCETALAMYQEEIATGFMPNAPLGYLISLLRKGVVHERVKEERQQESTGDIDFWSGSEELHERYHRGKWLMQHDGVAGPGSCNCCVDAGPYAGRAR